MTDTKPPLPTPRLFHVVLSYDVIVRADYLIEAESLARIHGPTNAVWSAEGGELHVLPNDVEIDEAVITRDGDHVTIEQCIAAGQAPYLRGVR